jgi:hypothetical protein
MGSDIASATPVRGNQLSGVTLHLAPALRGCEPWGSGGLTAADTACKRTLEEGTLRKPGRIAKIGILTVGLVSVLLLWASPASADATYQVYGTGGVGLSIRSAPSASSSRLGLLAEGTSISIHCQTYGDNINGSTIWDQLSSGGYVSDWYVNTPNVGTFSPGLYQCGQAGPPPLPAAPAIASYNRAAAAQWAVAHTFDPPEYTNADCTNFVSNAMHFGGGLVPTDWWYHNSYSDHSFSWTVAKDFAYQMYQHGYVTRQDIDPSRQDIPGAQIGDVILYDQADGNGFNHVAVIVQITSNGNVAIAEHTAAYVYRIWNRAWIESTNKVGFHAQLLHVRS